MQLRLSNVAAILCLLLALGCGGGEKKPEFVGDLVPVTGTVTLDGKPVAGATVQFLLPQQATKGEMAEGVTDASGKYELQTLIARASAQERKGALPGDYTVRISRITLKDGSPLPPGISEADAEAEGGASESIPARYSNYERSELRATVKPEPNVIDFDL
jgi:hypothetical protein